MLKRLQVLISVMKLILDTLDLGFNITYFDILVEDPIMGSNITNFQDNVLVQKIQVKVLN